MVLAHRKGPKNPNRFLQEQKQIKKGSKRLFRFNSFQKRVRHDQGIRRRTSIKQMERVLQIRKT